jgi:mRNA-degrading endonuclease RelE of RelBE toxin-antitoxin system
MKTFREIVESEFDDDYESEIWTKEDFIDLISDFSEDEINIVIEELVYILEENYIWEDLTTDSLRETLINLLDKLSAEQLSYITEVVLEMIDDDYDEESEETNEKMSNKAKMRARKLRKKPAFKKVQRLKKKCKKRFAQKIKKTKDMNIPYVCGADGKLHKGMKKIDRVKRMKQRKKTKHRILN